MAAEGGYPSATTEVGESNRASAIAFWALLGFTFVLLLAPQSRFPGLVPQRAALIMAAIALIAYAYNKIIFRQPITIFNREIGITVLLLLLAVATIPLSYWPGGSMSYLLDVYLKSLVIFWLLCNIVNTVPRMRAVFWALTLMGVPLALTAVQNFRSGLFMPEATAVKRIIGYDAPLTGNPNDLALMLNLILPLSVSLFLISGKRVVRAILAVIICVEIVGVILTFSRAAFLTVATLFFLYLWKLRHRPERKFVLALLGVMLLCLPLLVSNYVDRLATITDIESDPTGSSQSRWRDMVAAASFMLKHPILGAGVGMNILALNEERGPLWLVVHNVFLEYGVDLGVLGLVLFVALLAGCVRSATFVRRRSAERPGFLELFSLAEGIEISLLAFVVSAFFYPVGYQFYFYYLAGLAIAARCIYRTAEKEQISLYGRDRPA